VFWELLLEEKEEKFDAFQSTFSHCLEQGHHYLENNGWLL